MLDPAAEGRYAYPAVESLVGRTSTDPGEPADRLVRRSGGAGSVPKADRAYAAVDRYLKG